MPGSSVTNVGFITATLDNRFFSVLNDLRTFTDSCTAIVTTATKANTMQAVRNTQLRVT